MKRHAPGPALPSIQLDLPIKLSFFVAVKGPDGSAAVGKRQDSYNGAFSHTVKTNQFTITMLMPLHQPTTMAISRCTPATLLSQPVLNVVLNTESNQYLGHDWQRRSLSTGCHCVSKCQGVGKGAEEHGN
jgi:hypothetical protein